MSDLTQDISEVKRCKPVSEGGCDQIKPLTDFYSRVRKGKMGPYITYEGWCEKCAAARQKVKDRAKREGRMQYKDPAAPNRYRYEKSKDCYRIYINSCAVTTCKTEEQAKQYLIRHQVKNDIANLFFTLPTHGLKWDKETCTLKSATG